MEGEINSNQSTNPAKDVADDPEFDNLKTRPEFQALMKEFSKAEK